MILLQMKMVRFYRICLLCKVRGITTVLRSSNKSGVCENCIRYELNKFLKLAKITKPKHL